MALLTDGLLNTSGALQQYENAILGVAATEEIDVTAKASLAQEEIATHLHLFLDRSALHSREFLVRRHVDVRDIVVTRPLKRWHAYRTLAMIYRDAYNNQLNDRYQGKWTEYETLAAGAEQVFYRAGAGIVQNPVPRASEPLLTTIPLGVSGISYYVRISWINAFRQEGCASEIQQATTSDGSAMVVASAEGPEGIDSWNVYAGSGPESVQLQNATPIPIAGTWILPPNGLISGKAPGDGQTPEWWIVDRHVLPRG
ncbi:MAG: hypothetical protein ABSH09_18425 [Bryobacteraceae bacterium]|jgi:hypothetical protein